MSDMAKDQAPGPSRFDMQDGEADWDDDSDQDDDGDGTSLEERMADFQPVKLGRMDEPPGGWPQPDDDENQ